MKLTNNQRDARNAIYNYGIENGYAHEDIQTALHVAFIESTIGLELTNPDSSAYGLFQYTIPTWNDRHISLGDRKSQANQIQAFYNDLNNYKTRFPKGKNEGTIPEILTFPQYVYIKHHDGWNETNFDNPPGLAIYNQKINGTEPEYLDLELAGPYQGSLALHADIFVDAGVTASQDTVGCLKQADDNAWIDYFLEYSLTDTERQDIIAADPTDGIYIYADEP